LKEVYYLYLYDILLDQNIILDYTTLIFYLIVNQKR
jgi:hypothetical protein